MKHPTRARYAAEILWHTGCISFTPDAPVEFTSGRKSPVYVDVRRILGFPQERRDLMVLAKSLLWEDLFLTHFHVIAGGETAGIPFAAWLSDAWFLPMIYVRKQAKRGGRKSQIEGLLLPGQNVLLVEDLASEGTSKSNFIDAIRHAGGHIDHCFVLFTYGIFPSLTETMDQAGVRLHALTTLADVVEVAREDLGDLDHRIEKFMRSPDDWTSSTGSI